MTRKPARSKSTGVRSHQLGPKDASHKTTACRGSCSILSRERLHKTVLNEFYRVAFRKRLYRALEELQADLDAWLRAYNEARPHQGRWCYGKTPWQTFLDSVPLAKEKVLVA